MLSAMSLAYGSPKGLERGLYCLLWRVTETHTQRVFLDGRVRHVASVDAFRDLDGDPEVELRVAEDESRPA